MNATKRFTTIIWIFVLTFGLLGFNFHNASAASGCNNYYVVHRGDILSQIASAYGVSWRYLADINNLSNPGRIYAGQWLCVEGGRYNPYNPGLGSGYVESSYYGANARVVKVYEDDYLILKGTGLPRNARVEVTLNNIRVGGCTTNNNGVFKEAFDIPGRLRNVDYLSATINSGRYAYASVSFTNEDFEVDQDEPAESDIEFDLLRVDEDVQVVIRAYDFPESTKFDVLMADHEQETPQWYPSDIIATGDYTGFKETFRIPNELKQVDEITLRFKSYDGKWDITTWFENVDQQDGVVSDDEYYPDYSYSAFLEPTQVIRNEEVTIRFTDLQPGVEYAVYMGLMGTRGEDGIYVGTVYANRGGTVVDDFEIPGSLKGARQIAIRIEDWGGNFAYNWFTNQTTY